MSNGIWLDHAVQKDFEDFLCEDVAARSVGELDDVNLGLGKETGGVFVEKEQAHIGGGKSQKKILKY